MRHLNGAADRSVREEIDALDDSVLDVLTRHCPGLSSLELDFAPAITDVGTCQFTRGGVGSVV
jgi:hypothetical protein